MKKSICCLFLLVFFVLISQSNVSASDQVDKSSKTIVSDPVTFEIASWKMLEQIGAFTFENEVIEEYSFPVLLKKLKDIKNKKLSLIVKIKDLQDLKEKDNSASVNDQIKAESENYKKIANEYNNLQEQIVMEKQLIELSTSITANYENFNGKTITLKTHFKAIKDQREKEFVLYLRRYELLNPISNKLLSAKYVLSKVETK